VNWLPHEVQAATHGTEPRCLTILTARFVMNLLHTMGIVCENRGVVYLITAATNDFIHYVPRAGFDMYALRCRRCAARPHPRPLTQSE